MPVLWSNIYYLVKLSVFFFLFGGFLGQLRGSVCVFYLFCSHCDNSHVVIMN